MLVWFISAYYQGSLRWELLRVIDCRFECARPAVRDVYQTQNSGESQNNNKNALLSKNALLLKHRALTILTDRRLFHDNLFNLLPVIKQTASADIRLLGNCRGAWPQKGESVVFVSIGSPASRLLSALICCQRFVFVIRALPKTNSYYLRFISKVFVFCAKLLWIKTN